MSDDGNYEIIWTPQPGPQVDLITCPVYEILFGGARGGGKAQPLDARVLTPRGWRAMGDLRVGQEVVAVDGTSSKIIAVFDREPEQVYEVRTADGGVTRASAEHLWVCEDARSRGRNRKFGRKFTTLQLRERVIGNNRPAIPACEPAQFHNAPGIDPYLLGQLLGDGHISKHSCRVTTGDEETARVLERIGLRVAVKTSRGTPYYDCSVLKTMRPVKDWLAEHGLMGRLSYDKFVPEVCFTWNVEARWNLLRGLLDSDGWVSSNGMCMLQSTSQRLVEDVRSLGLSLGGVCSTHGPQAPKYTTRGGERVAGRITWRVTLRFWDCSHAFALTRKKERALERTAPEKRPLSRAIVSVEPLPDKVPTRCVQIDHPSSLYVTDDYIVTHNTDAVIGKWVSHANRYGSAAQGVMFRRTFKQLEEVLRRTRELYPRIGATYSVTTQTWTFPNGSALKLRHLDNEVDASSYQGHQYTFLVFEEATNWPTSRPIDMLRGTLRSAAGVPPQLILTANPGGPGHNWVKERYIQPARNGYKLINDKDSGLDRVYIPSKVTDNAILVKNDPLYQARLRQTGPGFLVKAWLEGDWDIVAGGFFDDVFNADKHVLRAFAIPPQWSIITSFDWGFSAPASLGIFARVTDYPEQLTKLLGVTLPRGSLVRVKEWYTVTKDDQGWTKANSGQRLNNEELGAGVARRYKSLPSYPKVQVADPSIFNEQGGPSPYEQMKRGAAREGVKLAFTKADNNRSAGWSRVRELLQNAAQDKPERAGLWIMDTCEDWLRTVPTIQADRVNPDDVDTDGEDHAADDTRYACMLKSRVPLMTKFVGG